MEDKPRDLRKIDIERTVLVFSHPQHSRQICTIRLVS